MLFTSNFRRGLSDHPSESSLNTAAISKTAAETVRILAKKRAQLRHRHTCSVLPAAEDDNLTSIKERIIRLVNGDVKVQMGHDVSSPIREISFMDPNTDRIVLVDTLSLINRRLSGSSNSSERVQRRSSIKNQRRPSFLQGESKLAVFSELSHRRGRSSVGNAIKYASISQPVPPTPATYAEPPSMPLPPLPKKINDDPWDDPQSAIIPPSHVPPSTNANIPKKPSQFSDFGGNAHSAPTISNIYPQVTSAPQLNDPDFDDDWSDEDEEEFGGDATSQNFGKTPLSNKMSNAGDSAGFATRQMGASKMKTINRFSNFVKTGMESFILSGSRLSTQSNEHYEIMFNNNQIEWRPSPQQYTCMVNKPKKESKLKGLKSFIAYSLTCSLSGIQVSRRYKHFDWLHEQLSNKYLLIPIPPLPEKQVSGRYEDDLIEHRKLILQLWVNKICRHPVLSQSEVWKHFITCTDTSKWKAGKRAAERDEYVGGNFFHCISTPPQPLLYDIKQINNIDQQVDNYAKSVRSMDESIRELHERITDTQKRMIGPYKSNWQKMAAAFDSLGRSLEMDQTKSENPVKNALKTSAHVLHKIGAEHEDHGKRGLEPILDYLYTYKGLYTSIPEIVNVHKSALSKMRDIKAEGRLPPTDAETIRERVDVTTYAMMAEISHLNQERDDDFRQMFGDFFAQQASFYTNMGRQMGELAETFKKVV